MFIYYESDGSPGGELSEADKAAKAGENVVALEQIAILKEEVATLRAEIDDLRSHGGDYAPAEHGHELPPNLAGLERDLADHEAEEGSPKNTHRRYGKVLGG